MENISLQQEIPHEMAGMRLDQAAAQLFPEYSRSRLQAWIKSGELQVNGAPSTAKTKIVGGELVQVAAQSIPNDVWRPEPIRLDVRYEDEDILVINKVAGVVVHPAAGHAQGTLLNAILHHHPDAAALPRAGIVHRLDKDTTGLMVVAKSLRAHNHLVMQLQSRRMGREYEAVVTGVMSGGGVVNEPIGRHPVQRKKMAVSRSGKTAITHYQVVARFRAHTHLRLQLETGRTHQIRVHMAHRHYPLVGDPLYGGRLKLPKAGRSALIDFLRNFKRQALHAQKLSLIHPRSAEPMVWESELPVDMRQLLELLDDDKKNRGNDEQQG